MITIRHLLVGTLLTLSLTAVGQPPPTNYKQAIRQLLLRSLKPSDLDRSKRSLSAKICRITDGSNCMDASGVDQPQRLTRVARALREWVLIVSSQSPDELGPVGYWIGSRHGKLLVSELPDDWPELIGPLAGSWRRHGPYVIGAGIDLARHSPSWADGDFRVFTIGPQGLILQQTGSLSPATSLTFRSKGSDDLIGNDNRGPFQTIEQGKIGTTERTVWKFRNGRYWKVSYRIIHDRVWAFDHLVTAVRRRQYSVIRQMLPNPRSRRWLVKQIWRCIQTDNLQLAYDWSQPDSNFGLYSFDSDQPPPPFQVHFKLRGNRWCVDRIVKAPID